MGELPNRRTLRALRETVACRSQASSAGNLVASSGRTLQLRESALTPKRAMGKTHVMVMAARNLELGRQNALLEVDDHPYQPQ